MERRRRTGARRAAIGTMRPDRRLGFERRRDLRAGAQWEDPTDDVDLHYDVAVGRLPFTIPTRRIRPRDDHGRRDRRRVLEGPSPARRGLHGVRPPRVGTQDDTNGGFVLRGTDTEQCRRLERAWRTCSSKRDAAHRGLYESAPDLADRYRPPLPRISPSAPRTSRTRGNAPASSGFAAMGATAMPRESIENLGRRRQRSGAFEHPTDPFDNGDGQVKSRGEQSDVSYCSLGIIPASGCRRRPGRLHRGLRHGGFCGFRCHRSLLWPDNDRFFQVLATMLSHVSIRTKITL